MLRSKVGQLDSLRKELTYRRLASRLGSKPRDPPKAATPVQLPLYPQGTSANVPYTADEIYRTLCTVSTSGPTRKHIDVLGVQAVADLPLEQLIPTGYLPPVSWLADPATSGGSNVFPAPIPPPEEKLRNGARRPGHEEFFLRAKEVTMDNEDALRILQRKPPLEGRPAIKLSHFRKMFEGLSDMAEYWDTSLDNYVNTSSESEAVASNMDKAADGGKGSETSQKTPGVSYTGRRIGNGEQMEPSYRVNTITAFVETIVWCFRCAVEPNRKDWLSFHNMLIRVPPSDNVYCTPEDRQQARRGVREGPMMGIQCRSSTMFRKINEMAGEGKCELRDLLFEVALGLFLAQKRDREGKQEIRHWEGKWWCTKPRWGGGPGGPVFEGDGEVTEEGKQERAGVKAKDEVKGEANDKGEKGMTVEGKVSSSKDKPKPSDPARKKQKLSSARAIWNAGLPPQSAWENNVAYQHVGKVESSDHDDVSSPISSLPHSHDEKGTNPLNQIYLISSVIHHISIVHLRVPTRYVAYIGQTTPPPADFVPSQHPWYVLKVRRSRWYDLFDKEDRVEAMRGVWGVVGWLMRSEKKEKRDGGVEKEAHAGGKYRF